MERANQSNNLLDMHNKLIADILTRYRTLVMLATSQARSREGDHRREIASVNGLAMGNELEGLTLCVKELLALSRRLKELWLFGPLGGEDTRIGEQARVDAEAVGELVNRLEERWVGGLVAAAGWRGGKDGGW